MESITIHPENNEQLKAIKAILTAFKIPFEKKEPREYDEEFINKIKKAEEDQGDYTILKSASDIDQFMDEL